MHIDSTALADTLAATLAELDRHEGSGVAAEGEIGRIGGHRLLLRIEPVGEELAGDEINLPSEAAQIVSD